MLGRGFWDRFRGETAGERARRIHQSWLSAAMRGEIGPFPRIPVRKVSEGGWDRVMRTPAGRRWAERWWRRTFDLMDRRSGVCGRGTGAAGGSNTEPFEPFPD